MKNKLMVRFHANMDPDVNNLTGLSQHSVPAFQNAFHY